MDNRDTQDMQGQQGNDQNPQAQRSDSDQQNDSGNPGGGVGRREKPGQTGVYPLSDSRNASETAPIEAEGAFGQGDRGIEGYYDSGGSQIIPDKELRDNG